MGAAGHQVSMVLLWDYTVSSRSIFFHGLKCLSMVLESLTNTITAWRTWISWVFLLTFWTTTQPSFQWPLHILKALKLPDLIAQVSKVIHHYYFNNLPIWVCRHYLSSCTGWEEVINTKMVHTYISACAHFHIALARAFLNVVSLWRSKFKSLTGMV